MSVDVAASSALSEDQVSQLRGLEERLANAQSATMSRLQGSDQKMEDEMRDMQENLFSARWYAMNEQINAFIHEIAEIRNTVGEMRNEVRVVQTTLRRSHQSLEDQLGRQREDLMGVIQLEVENRSSTHDELEQRFEQLRNCTEKVAEIGIVPAQLESRLQTLQHGLDQEAAKRATGDEDLARIAQEVSSRLQELSEVLRQHAAESAAETPGATGRDARQGSTGSANSGSISPSAKAQYEAEAEAADVTGLKEEVASEKRKRLRDRESTAQQLKELRLCLEAEVGARTAANERLDRQVHDLRKDFTTALNERAGDDKAAAQAVHSLEQVLRKDMQMMQGNVAQQTNVIKEEVGARKAGEDKLRRSIELEGQQRDNSDLQLGVLRESFSLLETQMKSRATRQDTEASIGQLTKQLASEVEGRMSGDEDLKRWVLSELKEQAHFFKSEIKNLLTTAHSSFSDEIRKLKTVIKTEQRDGPDNSPSTPSVSSGHFPPTAGYPGSGRPSYERPDAGSGRPSYERSDAGSGRPSYERPDAGSGRPSHERPSRQSDAVPPSPNVGSGSFPGSTSEDSAFWQRPKVKAGSVAGPPAHSDAAQKATPSNTTNTTPNAPIGSLPLSQRLYGMVSRESTGQEKQQSSGQRSTGSLGSSLVPTGEGKQAEDRTLKSPASPPSAQRPQSPRRSPRLPTDEQRGLSQMCQQTAQPSSAQQTPTRSMGSFVDDSHLRRTDPVNMRRSGAFQQPQPENTTPTQPVATASPLPTAVQPSRVVTGRTSTGSGATSRFPFSFKATQ